jgi:hypothetical protein
LLFGITRADALGGSGPWIIHAHKPGDDAPGYRNSLLTIYTLKFSFNGQWALPKTSFCNFFATFTLHKTNFSIPSSGPLLLHPTRAFHSPISTTFGLEFQRLFDSPHSVFSSCQ